MSPGLPLTSAAGMGFVAVGATGLHLGSPQPRAHEGVGWGCRPRKGESSPAATEFGHHSRRGADPAPMVLVGKAAFPINPGLGRALGESSWVGRVPSLCFPIPPGPAEGKQRVNKHPPRASSDQRRAKGRGDGGRQHCD